MEVIATDREVGEESSNGSFAEMVDKAANTEEDSGDNPNDSVSDGLGQPAADSSANAGTQSEPSQLPARISARKTPLVLKIFTPLAAAASVVCAIFLFPEKGRETLPALAGIYEMVGMHNTQGMQLKDVIITPASAEGKNPSFIVQGKIINRSDSEKDLPILRISAADSEYKTVRAWEFAKEDEKLKAGEEMPFQAQISYAASNVEYIVLDVGSGFEISYRGD
jgi:hypothetical protein